MNSIQYAMARAAYEAYYRNWPTVLFDDLPPEDQRRWIAAAKAAVYELYGEME